MSDKDCFWVVWCPNKSAPNCGAPTVRYTHSDDARKEARRLATENRGKQFFVLQAQSVSRWPEPEVQTEDLDEVPF